MPDILTVKLRRSYYKHEIWRNEQLNNLQKVEMLQPQLKQVGEQLELLEKLEEEDLGGAWLRWKYDY